MYTQEKILSVESIRGVACFMVLLSHLSLTFFPYLHAFGGEANTNEHKIQALIHESPLGFLFSGTSAVFIFFVLSGFILTKVALRQGSSPLKIFSMSIKRYPRLMMPALASCLIAYASFLAFDVKIDLFDSWINSYGSDNNYSLIGAIYSGTIDVFFGTGSSSYNPVLWTMMIELFGSFIIYIFCLNRMVFRVPYLAVIIFTLTLALTILKVIRPDLGLGLVAFYGGYLFSIYGKKISLKTSLILVVIGLYLAGAHNTSLSYSYVHQLLGDYTYKLCNFISGFLIVYSILFNEKLNLFFSGKIPVFMGKVSFSVYLIHMPIISTFGVLLFNSILNLTGEYNFSAIVSSILTILFIYICALFFYKFIDSKGMSFSNYLANYVIAKIGVLNKLKSAA